MSFIAGINLSDRVYLSADTRLTFKSGGKDQYLDNILKIQPLSEEIAIVVAGDIDLAAFIVRGLIKSSIDKTNIRRFREEVEDLVKKLCDSYQEKNGHLRSACLIFAGLDREKQKVIDMHRYMKIVTEFQKETDSPMNMKDIIFRGLEKKGSGGLVPISTTDSHVFSIRVSPQSLIVDDVAWGDFVAYGDRLSKENLPSRFFGQLEVATKGKGMLDDRAWLDIFMKTTAEKNKVPTVGGCITSLMISNKDSGMLIGRTMRKRLGGIITPDEVVSEVSIKNKELHCTIDGQKQRLIPFVKYPEFALKQDSQIEQMTL